jgi:hypothetical protein
MGGGAILRGQHRGGGILRWGHGMMGLTVATQKILQAQHVRRLQFANQYRPAATGFDVSDAAQDQRAHDALAEIGFRHDQRAKPTERDQKCFNILVRNRIDQCEPLQS